MVLTPVSIRLICAILLIICGTVTLGISAHVENAGRTFGFSSSTFTYDAFVGAFTLLFEFIFIIVRLLKPEIALVTLAGELGLAGLLWVFWLASGISTTKFTSESRSVCRHLDDLFEQPELEGLDPDALAAAKKILSSSCSELHAELAFIWIGFIVATFVAGYIGFLVYRARSQGDRDALKTSLKHIGDPQDPFADPSGNKVGPTVGVVNARRESA